VSTEILTRRKTIYKEQSNGFSVRLLKTENEIEEIRPFWKKHQWHPYTDIDYFLFSSTVEDHFICPNILVFYQNEIPVLLIIGKIRDKILNWKLGYKNIFKSQVRLFEVFYGGIIGDFQVFAPSLIADTIIQSLKNCEADVLLLNHLKLTDPLYIFLNNHGNWFFKDFYNYANLHRKLILPDSFDAYYQQSSKNKKKKIRRVINKIDKKFKNKIVIHPISLDDDIEQKIEHIEHIAKFTYQRGLGVGFFDNRETRKKLFFTLNHKTMKAYILYINDEPVAFQVGYLYKGCFYSSSTGYNSAYGLYSPGLYLIIKIIEELCLNPDCQSFDFGFGDSEYKRMLSNEVWQESNYFIFTTTFKGIKLKLIKSITYIFNYYLKKGITKFKFLFQIKQIWRNKHKKNEPKE
jgi:hypothetical protein